MSKITTAIAKSDIKTAATRIGDAGDAVKVDELNDVLVHPGVFQAGIWLKRLVDSRRATVEAHARELQMALQEIEAKLSTAAEQIVGVDQNNAENVQKAESTLTELKNSIGTRAPNLLKDDPAPSA